MVTVVHVTHMGIFMATHLIRRAIRRQAVTFLTN